MYVGNNINPHSMLTRILLTRGGEEWLWYRKLVDCRWAPQQQTKKAKCKVNWGKGEEGKMERGGGDR